MAALNVGYKMADNTSIVLGAETMRRSLADYKVMLWATLATGLAGLAMMVVWVFVYRGGVAWDTSGLQFNWHILTMTWAMVYLCALELMIFRALRYGQKKYLKLIHAGFMVPIVVLLVIGYWSILDNHLNTPGRLLFYSFHSWMAILSTILYVMQGVFGFVTFLWPGVATSLRGAYMPFHVFLGLTTFVMGVTTTLLGLFETIKKIPKFSVEAIMMNICGILIAVFTAMVVFLQTRPQYKRQPLPDD